MTAEFVVFWVLAPVALGAAIAMILLRNAIHAALMLVLNFLCVAALYAVLEAQFLAVTQLIVYAGAIMVLFLFVLMLLGVHRDEPASRKLRGQGPTAVVLGVVFFGLVGIGVAGSYLGEDAACPTEAPAPEAVPAAAPTECAGLAEANAEGNVRGVGLRLFTDYVWPFEVTSVLLVIAAIGAMVLGRRRERPEELVDQPSEEAVE